MQNENLLIYHNDWEPTDNYVMFDLDNTLITTKSGKTFPKDENDIKPLFENTISKLNKSNVVIFTNQLGLLKDNKGLSKDQWLSRLKILLNQLTNKFIVFASLGTKGYYLENSLYYAYRKSGIGMYKEFLNNYNNNILSLNRIYVGDALGRSTDFSDCDIKFAANCSLIINSPEEYFQDQPKNYIELPKIINSTIKLKIKKYGKELILMVGSPASGKSTFVKLYFSDYKIINQDTLKTKLKCLSMTEQMLKENENIIVDNTNPTKEVRKEYIDLAKKYNYSVRIFIKESTRVQSEYFDNLRFLKTSRLLSSVVFNVYYGKYIEPNLNESDIIKEIIKIPFSLTLDPKFNFYF